jgi:4-amino-4-deoxy-L-arabinose transferase-like glycosyltransferase
MPRARAAALGAILLLAAGLRFTGLGWGLRHPPHPDERVFVENARQMAERGDLDHRYYEYPALVFHLLRPALAAAPEGGPRAYLLARATIAAFGVLGCAAAFLLGRALAGAAVGLLAALLLAVSPLAVHTAHMVRPDVVLQVFVTGALIALLRVGPRLRADAVAGAWIGAALAVKFSGAFLGPSYLLRRLLAAGPRARGAALAAAVAAGVFLLTTPYALLHAREFLAGVQTQVGHHYEEDDRATGLGLAPAYALAWVRALGGPAAGLALAGAVLVLRRDARRGLPLVVLPLVTIGVMATQQFLFSRHLLPSLAVACVLAAIAVEAIARAAGPRLRLAPPALAAVLGLAVAAVPLAASFAYVRDIRRPGTRDLALDWARAHLPAGAHVLSTVERFGLDPSAVELSESAPLGPHDRPLVLEMDHVLATGADDAGVLAGATEQARFVPESAVAGPTIRVLAVPAGARPAYRALALRPGALTASENGEELPAAVDGSLATLWRTADPQRPGDWIVAALEAPVELARIELVLGPHTRFAAREVQVAVSSDGRTWMDVRARAARPAPDRQRSAPASQVLVLAPPVRAPFVRVGLRRSGAHRWGVAELRLFAAP